jgi:hypothetical protein
MKLLLRKHVNHLLDDFEDKIKKSVANEMTTFERTRIPNCVSLELVSQVSGFLNNHRHMQEILNQHTNVMTRELSDIAKKIISEISNEDQYHVMQTQIRQEAEKRVENMINLQTKFFNNEVVNMKKMFQSEIETIPSLNKQIATLKSELQQYIYIVGTIFMLQASSVVIYYSLVK